MTIEKQKENVRTMFNIIAPRYDFINHFLSFGIDKHWRRKVRKKVKYIENLKILDIATGTGDLAIELLKLNPDSIIGIDIAERMVAVGRIKLKDKKLSEKIKLLVGDSLDIKFEEKTFDLVTCAFGVRNFEDLNKGLSEMFRVIKNNGQLIILEFSKTNNKFFGTIYSLYFHKILPFFGKIISKNLYAYNYLPASVDNFFYGEKFMSILKNIGFQDVKQKKLFFGIASIYCATKILNF